MTDNNAVSPIKNHDRAYPRLKRLASAQRPVSYFIIIFLAMVAAFGLHMRKSGILACPSDGAYDGDRYLVYCDASAYGDYDHGAFWFNLEPEERESAAKADVLFLGSSRLGFGFTSEALRQWAIKHSARYYLLGFTHGENMTFFTPLLRSINPRPRAYVINVDGFFTDKPTEIGREVMNGDATTIARYKGKRAWQPPHRILCEALPALCGHVFAYYRQRQNGEWILRGSSGNFPSPSGESSVPLDAERVMRDRIFAEKFIQNLGIDRNCIVLTYLPPRKSEREYAAALASSLGFKLISPELSGLQTFDGAHLEPASAEKFSAAFLEEAGSTLQQCVWTKSAPANGAGVSTEHLR